MAKIEYKSVALFTQPVWDGMPIQSYGHGTRSISFHIYPRADSRTAAETSIYWRARWRMPRKSDPVTLCRK